MTGQMENQICSLATKYLWREVIADESSAKLFKTVFKELYERPTF